MRSGRIDRAVFADARGTGEREMLKLFISIMFVAIIGVEVSSIGCLWSLRVPRLWLFCGSAAWLIMDGLFIWVLS